MFFRKSVFMTMITFIVILAGCGAAKERQAYVDDVLDKVEEENAKQESSMQEFLNTLISSQPEEAVDVISEKLIPGQEKVLDILENADVSDEEMVAYNNLAIEATELKLETQAYLRDLFEEIMEKKEAGNEDELDMEDSLETLHDLNEQSMDKTKEFTEETKALSEKHDDLEFQEGQMGDLTDIDVEEVNAEYDDMVRAFAEMVEGTSTVANAVDLPDIDEALFSDQGNPEIVFEGNAKIDGTFQLEGKSNLPDGAVLQLKTYQYGTKNPYFKGDIPVEADGSFSVEAEVEEDALDGHPMRVRIAYVPDDKDNERFVGKYGAEGEKLEGPFVHKYTNIKRTRHGAFANAYLDMEEGAEAELEGNDWEEPEDYGDLDIWMEVADVEVKDTYYDVKMKSNLVDLTHIKADIEVSGYEVAGHRSRTYVLADGSFRFLIPRPDIDDEDVNIIVNAVSDMAIETEELYGENGEDFEGDLVENTKKRQQIEYKIPIKDYLSEEK